MRYILGMDVGTTSIKAVLFDENATPVKSVTKDYTLLVKGSAVEFPAKEYRDMVVSILDEIRREYPIYAMSIDTQCETLIVADEDGEPLSNAIVWLDNRAVRQADEIRERFGEKLVYEITGQPEITATWPASKLLWLRQERPEVFSRIRKIFLLEDYLLYVLTGRFITEQTLQSSTIYFDIHRRTWWREMLDFIGVDPSMLPEILPSGVPAGEYQGIRVATGAIDQIAGAIGAGVIAEGTVSEMTGTTMAVFAPTSKMPPYDPACKIPCHLNYDGKFCLLLWSSTAGIALKWFKNQFCESFDFGQLDTLAASVPAGSEGLTFLPYLCGSTIPRYDPDARGVFWGLGMEHTRAHAVRGILEAVACMLKANLDYVGIPYRAVRTMGGGAKSPLWCQIKADMTGKTFITLQNEETACLGSAILAGVATGIFESVTQACERAVQADKIYPPSGEDYTECYRRWRELDEKLFQ